MNPLSMIMLVFSLIAAVDRIFGNKLGLGREFERGFMMLGPMALSMIGMIVIAPGIAQFCMPALDFLYNTFGIDPSLIPALLFANDMGGAPLAVEVAKNDSVGMYNAMVVTATMGATVSYSIPLSMSCVKKEKHRELMLGLLCGIVTIPVGGLLAGLFSDVPLRLMLLNLLPLIIFSLILAVGLLYFPEASIRVFSIFGWLIKAIITVGLGLGVLKFVTGIELIKGLDSIEEASAICLNAAVVLSGAFPLVRVVSQILAKPMSRVADSLQINKTSAMGLISSLATNTTTFEMMNDMDPKGTVLNSAFAVSGAFTFAAHLAFTLAFCPGYLPLVITAKLVAGFSSLFFAALIYRRIGKTLGSEASVL